MLITFHSKVVAEVLMLTDHAGALLQAAGKSFGDKIPERGVFTPSTSSARRSRASSGPSKNPWARATPPTKKTKTRPRWRPWRARSA